MTFLWSCTSSMKYTWTKENYQGNEYNKILVVVMSSTQQGRMNSENIMVENLAKEGITATNSLTVFPPVENIDDLTEDEIGARIMAGGYDAYVQKMMKMFQDPLANEPKHPLDVLRDRLLPCRSISEVRNSMLEAEHNLSE